MTKLILIAAVLNIEAHQGKWVMRRGPILRELGEINANREPETLDTRKLSLERAVCKAIHECDLNDPSDHVILPVSTTRARIYMEIEQEITRQEAQNGEKIIDALGTDPRQGMDMMIEQFRLAAMALSDPRKLVVELMRLAVIAVSLYEWSIRWIATLQTKPLSHIIHPFREPPQD